MTAISSDERADDAELADAEDPLDERGARADALGAAAARGRSCGLGLRWPVAARIDALLVGLGARELGGRAGPRA